MTTRRKRGRKSEQARRHTRRTRSVAVLGALALVAVAGVSAWLLLPRSEEPVGLQKAVIVDQLSLTYPNPDFIEEATETLEQAGYAVDYFPGEAATIRFFSSLPSYGYDLVIVRAHSARFQAERKGAQVDEAVLFTSDLYSEEKVVNFESSYPDASNVWPLSIVRYQDGGDRYLGIGPDFIEHRMSDNFEGATVILMGCDIFGGEELAEAFVQKGADSVVGWDREVSASHTDLTTSRLLELLVSPDDLSPEDAVAQTMSELGPDPTFDSTLRTYSPES